MRVRIPKVPAERARTLTELVGSALVSVGVGQIYLPAGIIVAGLLLIAGSIAKGLR